MSTNIGLIFLTTHLPPIAGKRLDKHAPPATSTTAKQNEAIVRLCLYILRDYWMNATIAQGFIAFQAWITWQISFESE